MEYWLYHFNYYHYLFCLIDYEHQHFSRPLLILPCMVLLPTCPHPVCNTASLPDKVSVIRWNKTAYDFIICSITLHTRSLYNQSPVVRDDSYYNFSDKPFKVLFLVIKPHINIGIWFCDEMLPHCCFSYRPMGLYCYLLFHGHSTQHNSLSWKHLQNS